MKESNPHGGGRLVVVSKTYCSSSEVVLTVRKRPRVVSGGGFVVMEPGREGNDEVVIFRVDGCGVLGTSGELVVRDGDGDPLLLIRRERRGCLEAIGVRKKWRGYRSLDYQKPVFTVQEANNSPCSCSWSRNDCVIRISTEERNLEIRGSFPERNCILVDYSGKTLAKVCTKKNEVEWSKDTYQVVVTMGIDQAFVCGVVAVLDHIHGESTGC